LREKLLQRYVPFQINDPYSPDKLVALQDALNSSNYFQQVTINPLQQQIKQQQVPIQVILVPRKSQQSNVGIGYGTDTGPRLGIGNEWRYLNSYGHRLTTLLRISSIQKSFQ